MDKKVCPKQVLPTRDPPQDKRLTQTESEGLETDFPSKRTRKKKKAGMAILISEKLDFKRGPQTETQKVTSYYSKEESTKKT